MKQKSAKNSIPTTKLLLLLLALATMFTATQCTQSPPPDQEVPDSTQEDPKTSRSECDDTPYEELGVSEDFACHSIIVTMKVGYEDEVYTVEDFPEIECDDVRVIMVATTPLAKELFSQMLALTLTIHSKRYVLEAVDLLNQREDVMAAEPGYYDEPATIPNDPAYIAGIEPIEDYELPSIHYGIYFSFYSMEDIFAFFEIMPHLSKDSEAHATLQTAEFYDCTTYYLPNPEKVPDGYEFICAKISPKAASFMYSSTPENYQEYPWYWPDETTWRCEISFERYEINRVININGEPVRFADDYVIPYKIGTNDHVTE